MYISCWFASKHQVSLFVRPVHTSLVPGPPLLLFLAYCTFGKRNTCHARWRQAGAQRPTTYTNTLHVRTKSENKLLTATLSTLEHANVSLVMEHFTTKIKYVRYLNVYPDPPPPRWLKRPHTHVHVHVLVSNPGFPFRILSYSFWRKIGYKIRNGKPGFEAIHVHLSCVDIIHMIRIPRHSRFSAILLTPLKL